MASELLDIINVVEHPHEALVCLLTKLQHPSEGMRFTGEVERGEGATAEQIWSQMVGDLLSALTRNQERRVAELRVILAARKVVAADTFADAGVSKEQARKALHEAVGILQSHDFARRTMTPSGPVSE